MNSITALRALVICVAISLTVIFSSFSVYAFSTLLPEDFKNSVTMQPAITKIIEEDDVENALVILNKMHSDMAEEGWELYQVMEYIDDEDFEGFFVTYKKLK